MDLLRSFRDFIVSENLFSPGDHLLLAVSGGIDSVVLCELCHHTGYRFSIAHANFGLRGEESNRDERFVRELAAKYQAPFFTRAFDARCYAEEHKVSIQLAARELRYGWFRELVATSGTLSRIVTAHHLDDNIETLVMNFFKGTGMAGLHGILPEQDLLVRPLLFARKEDLKEFARDRQLDWVEDSSNASDAYTRNHLRNNVLPMLEQVWPSVSGNLAENLGRFREAEELYRQAVALHKRKLLEFHGDEVHIPVLKLKKVTPLRTILYEIIHDYGFSSRQTGEARHLLDSGSGKYILSATHRILRDRNWLIISPRRVETTTHVLIEEPMGIVPFADGNLILSLLPATSAIPADSGIALLDASMIRFPLILRKWRQGDYFYPLGLRKKKKLGRFFIDNKLSLAEKEKVWVIEMDKKIVWIVGHRIDDRFRITSSTVEALKIEARLA